jgi:uncharacterized protein (TIRG00374 family)
VIGPRLRWAATVAVTIAILALLFRRFGGGSSFASILRGASLGWVGLSLLCGWACVLLGAERWRLVLAAMGHPLGFWRSLEVVLATWPLAMVTPSRANDLLRPLGVQDVVPLPAGAASVVAEKAIDLMVLLLFTAAGAALQGLWAWAGVATGLALAEVAFVATAATHRAWLERIPVVRARRALLEKLFAAIAELRRAPLALVSPALISLAIRFLNVGMTHTLLVAVGARVRLYDTATLWPAATLVGVAPLTLAGMGTRDAAFIHLLAERGAHVDAAQVLAATIAYSFVGTGFFAILGLPFMFRESMRDRRQRLTLQ